MKTPKESLFVGTGIVSIFIGVVASVGFFVLGKVFGYPEIIRETPSVILGRLYKMRSSVPYLYYIGVGGAGLGIFFLSLLLRKILLLAGEDFWGYLGKNSGMIVGVLLYAGIIRWTFLFPMLALLRVEGTYDPQLIDLVFEAFNTYVGDSVAEHVQFTFMFFWLMGFCVAMLKTKIVSKWIAVSGLVIGAIILYGNLEFFGLPGAFWANRKGSDFVGLWTIALGVNLILGRKTELKAQEQIKS